MDGLHYPVTVETLSRAWFGAGAAVKYAHRLDHGTSGVLLGAFTAKSAAVAGKAFETRQTSKVYMAVVAGHVEAQVLEAPVGPLAAGDFRMACYTPKAKPAQTTVEVVARCLYLGEPCTKLRLTPHTGRRHQLRVHLRVRPAHTFLT